MKIWAFAKAVPQSLAAGGMVSVSHMTAGRKLVETCESRESPAIQNPRFVVSAPGTEGWRNLAKGCQRHSKAILMVSLWNPFGYFCVLGLCLLSPMLNPINPMTLAARESWRHLASIAPLGSVWPRRLQGFNRSPKSMLLSTSTWEFSK